MTWPSDLEGDPQAVLTEALARYGSRLAIASSFSAEDSLLVAWAARIWPGVRVFSLDTGRLPEATYEVAEALSEHTGVRIEWVHPEAEDVEGLLRIGGPYGFRASLEARHDCCAARKVRPLQRVLRGLEAWVTGQRRDQSVTRTRLEVLEPAPDGPLKINPLAGWTAERVWAEVRARKLPYNRLYDAGYASIGCAPCTRAIQPGEDERAGRWWWERPEHKECGLHRRADRQGEIR